MSRATDVMQYILDLLTDGILVSDAANRQLGFSLIEPLTDGQLPFVQAYAPVIVTPTADQIQSKGDLTFTLNVIDKAAPDGNDLEKVADDLRMTLSVDSGLRGIGAHCFISDSFVDTVQFPNDKTILELTIVCEYLESNSQDFVDLADFTDVLKFSAVNSAVIGNSVTIKDGMNFGRDATNNSMFTWDNASDPDGFTDGPGGDEIDLSVTKNVRVVFYQRKEASDATTFSEIWIGDVASFPGAQPTDYRRYVETRSFHGWNEFVFQLDSPFSTVGAPGGLSRTTSVAFVTFATNPPPSTDVGSTTYTHFGYMQRDVGDNAGHGVTPGI